MRPIPFPERFHPGLQRIVLAAPNGDLTDDEVAPLEIAVDPEYGLLSHWTLTPDELMLLLAGGTVELLVASARMSPVSLAVWPPASESPEEPTRCWVTIEMGNDAMTEPRDLANAVQQAADGLLSGHGNGKVRDLNGNTVGGWGMA